MDESAYRLTCHQLFLPNQRTLKALEYFGSATALMKGSTESLSRFFRDKDLRRIQHWQSTAVDDQTTQAVMLNQHLANAGANHICILDSAYPPLLREIPDSPAFLFVRGDISNLSRPQIAIVGSRKMTPLGGKTAREFARKLGQAGMGITSGMALGIDSSAHKGALDAGATTIAVLGTGIDSCYPRSNFELQQQILTSGGVLVSEYPFGIAPLPSNFPRRNRIITGLSMAALVVEASEKSGSLVSARLAAEQGREVFVVPGSINSPASSGCHQLIRDGATLVTEPAQVLENINPMLDIALRENCDQLSAVCGQSMPNHHWLLEALGSECLSVDDLCDRCDKPPQDVAAAITELELDGLISASAFGYQRIQ